MATMSSAVGSSSDPTAMLNNQLASALSTLGDAQFWEETISPATIRNELSSSDPSNANSTPVLLKGMKWLLASISKGRDVSDFYPHVVKLVGAKSLEVRKMVYTYLVQYADHDATTRELSLLSINSFQRGLADHEQLIRALALRVLSSIRIADILQIQILGVQKCSKDRSPYVRKCAANALAKLSPRCDDMQREMLLDIVKTFLDTDTCTMVLSSAVVAFCELCPERLDLLHTSYRKICHLLTDMDEWGQVVIIDLLARYCRTFFKQPKGWKGGTAEKIDRERRVRRRIKGAPEPSSSTTTPDVGAGLMDMTGNGANQPAAFSDAPKKIKRRVVQKGFYSDEEDESGEEEVYAESPLGPPLSTATAMRQRNILGVPGVQPISVDMNADEDMDIDEDHRLLLQSSLSLLKSRNAGVVLSVCSLLYYCGVSSVKTRSAVGKALVRIHRDRREIQYVVLTSIRTLVTECPSAFAPFLNDFYVKALDPPHTRIIKIDILVSLALEPAAIEVVLKELRTYIRNGDKTFVCAAIRAVGRVAELARIVYDRHGAKTGDAAKERSTANRIALDCLYGLAVVTETSDSKVVVGEAVVSIQNILAMLGSDAGEDGSLMQVEDPNSVQPFALRRVLLLLVQTLSTRVAVEEEEEEGSGDDDEPEPSELEKVTMELPPKAVASALSLVGDWLSNIHSPTPSLQSLDGNAKSTMRLELVRLLVRAFPDLDSNEKEQGIHLASKFLVSSASGVAPSSANEVAACEHVLSIGRVDVNPDVKDRARFESSILHVTIGLKHDTDALELSPSIGGGDITVENAKGMLLDRKPCPSFLPVEDDETVDKKSFRFGSLSSLVGHRARAYLSLPGWAEKNSPKALRDPVEAVKEQVAPNFAQQPGASGGFYDGDGGDSSSSDDDSSSSSSESSDGQNADSESESDSSDDSSTSSDGPSDGVNLLAGPASGMQNMMLGTNPVQPMGQAAPAPVPTMQPYVTTIASSDDDSSSSDSSSAYSSDSGDDYNGDVSSANIHSKSAGGNLLGMGGMASSGASTLTNGSSSAMDDLKGLVMAPVAVDESQGTDPNIENDSGAWIELVRPELCAGLSVMGRYLRGPTRNREAQLKGLDPDSPNVVCLQVQFANKKTDSASLRRIRIVPRSGSSGAYAVKKSLCPPEIPELKKGQVSFSTVCFLFASASNREGDLVAKVEVKSLTGGSVPVEFKPSLGDLLRPHKMKAAEFDSTMQTMQGFQRVVSKFHTDNFLGLPASLVKVVALTSVGKLAWKDNKLRLVGGLPVSTDLVLVLIQCDSTSGSGTITVCCDNAVAVNSITNTLKRAIS